MPAADGEDVARGARQLDGVFGFGGVFGLDGFRNGVLGLDGFLGLDDLIGLDLGLRRPCCASSLGVQGGHFALQFPRS